MEDERAIKFVERNAQQIVMHRLATKNELLQSGKIVQQINHTPCKYLVDSRIVFIVGKFDHHL